MDFFNLEGKVAMITGGNGGIGLAYAKGLVKAGAQVAIWGRNEDKNSKAVRALKEIGGKASSFVCDVTNQENINAAFNSTLAHFGKVDICFANAGASGSRKMLHQLPDEKWNSLVELNLNSVVYTYRKVIDHLIERKAPGKLIVTSSVASKLGSMGAAGYSTTKTAVLGLTRALAIELGPYQIQANAILPGYIVTEMTENAPEVFVKSMQRRTSSGQLGTLDQMEGIAVFLASSASDYMTGQSLVMDGGYTIHPM